MTGSTQGGDFTSLPRSRAEAKATGATHYFTGRPCKHGHVDRRTTTQARCAECVRVRQRARLQDPEFRKRHNQWCLAREKRKSADPEFVKRRKESDLRTRQKPEVKQRKRMADKARHARPEVKARKKRWADMSEAEKAKCNARCSARRARIRQGTPVFLSREHRSAIWRIYEESARRTRETGVRHHVDHIVPLLGEKVSGLHVPWNLRIVPAEVNQRKYNRMDEG